MFVDYIRDQHKGSVEYWKDKVREMVGENTISQITNGVLNAYGGTVDFTAGAADTVVDAVLALGSCTMGAAYCDTAINDLKGSNKTASDAVEALASGQAWDSLLSTVKKAQQGDQKALEDVAGILTGILTPAKIVAGNTGKVGNVVNKVENTIANESKVASQAEKELVDAGKGAAGATQAGREAIGVPVTQSKNPLSPVQQYDAYGNEIVYRTMSPEQFKQFERTGILPATTETSISPVLGYSSKYNGVTVKIAVKPGTFSELEKIGISANEATTKQFPNMSTQKGKWMDTNTRFKVEGGQMTTQLGQGKGIEIFNNNIVHFEQVQKAPKAN